MKHKEKIEEEKCECGHEHSHDISRTAHNEKELQEKIMEVNMLDSRMKQLEQSLNMIDQQIMEQQLLQLNIDEIKKVKKGQEMLFPLGKNVFVKGKIEDEKLLINIGGRVVVKKDGDKAKEIVERQKLQLVSVRNEINEEIEKIISEISLIEQSIRQ